ncbi:hypothetical protein TNCV_4178911 [Trichonephila clavipes]|nr:hypothetical protein TNCV_4178911 [Trichonephila clavipes]
MNHQDFQQIPSIFPLDFEALHSHPPSTSLISCVTKLFEKILLSRIQAFSDAHNLIPDLQHSFRKKTSTCHQLLRTTNKTIGGFNSHRTTEGLGESFRQSLA